jgi:hypothetical protein
MPTGRGWSGPTAIGTTPNQTTGVGRRKPWIGGTAVKKNSLMKIFDPHIHMTSRTTDDYQARADAGIRRIEPVYSRHGIRIVDLTNHRNIGAVFEDIL